MNNISGLDTDFGTELATIRVIITLQESCTKDSVKHSIY